MCGFFKMNCLGLLMFLPLIQSLLVFVARVVENYIPGSETLDLGAWCGAGAPHSRDIPPKLLSTTCMWGTNPFLVCIPTASLDGCGFFNSVVVRLPFNSITVGSE